MRLPTEMYFLFLSQFHVYQQLDLGVLCGKVLASSI